jgi:hypothetical protein
MDGTEEEKLFDIEEELRKLRVKEPDTYEQLPDSEDDAGDESPDVDRSDDGNDDVTEGDDSGA